MYIIVKLVSNEKIEFHVAENICTIGRSPKCNVVIPHDGISRQHCKLELKNGEMFVTDLNSTNGVTIDGNKIVPGVETEFKTYLPLAFGPVQSLMVELDEHRTSSNLNTITTTFIKPSATPQAVKTPTDTKTRPIPVVKKGINFSFIFMNLLAFLILAGAVYWYAQKEDEVEPTEVAPKARKKSQSSSDAKDYF